MQEVGASHFRQEIAQTSDLRRLSEAERRQYDDEGYVIVPSVFPEAELETMSDEIDRIFAKRGQDSDITKPNGWVFQLGLASEHTRDFAQDPRILSLIEEIVQPGIAIYSAKLATKLPRSDEVCHWHQDDAYYRQKSQSATRCSIWVPLQDANEENGCMWVVPKSHGRGLQEHANKDSGMCRLSMNENEIDLSDAIPVPVEAGSALIFSALLWHGSKGNRTDAIRRAFIVSYQEATATGGNGAQWKILRPA